MGFPHAIESSSIDRKAYSIKSDVEDSLVISATSKSRCDGIFDEDMVVLDLKFCGPCKHSWFSLCWMDGLQYSIELI